MIQLWHTQRQFNVSYVAKFLRQLVATSYDLRDTLSVLYLPGHRVPIDKNETWHGNHAYITVIMY